MTEFQVWFWFVLLPGAREALHSAQAVLVIFGVIISCAVMALLMVGHIDGSEKSIRAAPVKSAIAIVILCFVMPFVRAAIPTEKQAAAIILIPAVTQSERIKGVGDKTLDMLNGKLDQWLKDMAGGETKAKKEEKI